VLDLGCGSGLQAQLIARRGPSVTGVDPGEKYIRNANRHLKRSRVRKRVDFHCTTLDKFECADSTFDFVFSFCVMEHIPNLEQVLRRLHRLLKPGAEIHTTLDALANVKSAEIVRKHQQMHKVVRYFRPADVERVFGEAGFRVEHQHYILRSEKAVQELTRQVNGGDSRWSASSRRRGVREFNEAEARHPETDPGIMILCRFKKI
jgi:ubiquinone biosynthesis O-methyltransferase